MNSASNGARGALSCLEPAPARGDELPSPLSPYAPEYLEFSVGDEEAEGSEDTEGRPSLEGADMFCGCGYITSAVEEGAWSRGCCAVKGEQYAGSSYKYCQHPHSQARGSRDRVVYSEGVELRDVLLMHTAAGAVELHSPDAHPDPCRITRQRLSQPMSQFRRYSAFDS
jgi:hypothetical protein